MSDERLAQAMRLHRQGDLQLAEMLYRSVLSTAAGNAQALAMLGMLEAGRGHHEEAAKLLTRAIGQIPRNPGLHLSCGLSFKALRRYEEAVASYDAAIALLPGYFEAHHNRGVALRYLGRLEAAAESFTAAIRIDGRVADTHNLLGLVQHRLGRHEDALASYDRALAIEPESPMTVMNRGVTLYESRRFEDGLAALEHALAMAPGNPDIRINLGNVLLELDRAEEALALWRGVLAEHPGQADVLMNLANALRDLNRHGEALTFYEQALALDEANADIHWNLSLCLLAMGDWQRGWAEYEWRRRLPALHDTGRVFDCPVWLGQEPISGKSILVYAEQGLGDTILFCRYATELSRRGARVTLEVQAPLKQMLGSLEGVDRLISRGEPAGPCDFHSPLLSLPLALDTRPDSVPGTVPYLRCDPDLHAHWRQRMGPARAPRIGLAWSGNLAYRNNHRRSIGLAQLLASLPSHCELWSLQMEVPEKDEALVGPGRRVGRFERNEFPHTAAQIASMDAVICVDTSIAHLAAALGKPTWLLLAYKADWRWLWNRDDSPWYPDVTLFRQQIPGEWDAPLLRLRAAMDGLAARP